jgi:hypothetical protein
MASAAQSSELQWNPAHLRLAYITFFLVQTFDCFLFTSLSPQLFTDRSILTGPTIFFIRSNAVTLFPFVLLVFMLRGHHISTAVGQRVAWAYTLFHGLALVFVGWTKISGSWHFEQFWASVGFHGAWFASGVAALLGY